MKVGSIELYTYLLDAGVLNGTPEEIDRVKFEYRRLYKQRWKKGAGQRKEVRFDVTAEQLAVIKSKAEEHGQRHTTYARSLILSAAESRQFIPYQDQLLKALQLVGMAAIAMERNLRPMHEVRELLGEAEAILMNYIKN